MEIKIIKIGGSVLKEKSRFASLAEIIANSEEKVVLVASAFFMVTRDLRETATIAENGDERSAAAIIERIIGFHREIFDSLGLDDAENFNAALAKIEAELGNLLRGVSITKELTPRTLDSILAFGETLALEVIERFLTSKGANLRRIDSKRLIVTDSNFGAANPLVDETKNLAKKTLQSALTECDIVLTQGFVAADKEGEPTTMGFESSNLTAALLGAAANTSEIAIYADVAGVRSIDPKYSDSSYPIGAISFDQAYFAAKNGLKLIHPKMIDFVANNSLKLTFRSAVAPEGDFTLVGKEKTLSPIVVVMEDVFLVDVSETPGKSALDSKQKTALKNAYKGAIMKFYADSTKKILVDSDKWKTLRKQFNLKAEQLDLITAINVGEAKFYRIIAALLDKYIVKRIAVAGGIELGANQVLIKTSDLKAFVSDFHNALFEK